jgi:mono/diheme cytochrome c family protein
MRPGRFPAAIVLGVVVLAWQEGPRADEPAPASAEPAALRAAVDRYCVVCHLSYVTTQATATGIVLDKADLSDPAGNAALWERVAHKLRTGEMPPAGMERPDQATYAALAGWLESHLDRAAAQRPTLGVPASIV